MKSIINFTFLFIFAVTASHGLAQETVTSGASAAIETVKEKVKEVAEDKTESAKTGSEEEAKTENIWKTLSRITYRKEYDELMGFKIDKPVFSKQVQGLEGREITIKGYVIPVEGYKSHTEFIFSAFPYNMCFFCGGAGPETVMEVLASEPVKYSAEQVTLKGKIMLNADDINRLMYQLVDATLVD